MRNKILWCHFWTAFQPKKSRYRKTTFLCWDLQYFMLSHHNNLMLPENKNFMGPQHNIFDATGLSQQFCVEPAFNFLQCIPPLLHCCLPKRPTPVCVQKLQQILHYHWKTKDFQKSTFQEIPDSHSLSWNVLSDKGLHLGKAIQSSSITTLKIQYSLSTPFKGGH